MPLVLTFDMGTQSARAMLVDPEGNVAALAQKRYETPYLSPNPGWAEQDPEFYWRAVCEVGNALKAKAGGLWKDIIAVTCTTIRDTCLCLDENGAPLRNVILWLDKREAKNLGVLPPVSSLMFEIARVGDTVRLQRKVSACNWIAKNEPEVWAKTRFFVLISAWLTLKLCGSLTDSTASTIGHVPFDSKIRNWMKKTDRRRGVFEIDEGMQYPLVEPGETLGKITAAAASQTGVPEGLPLIATGSDKGCETLGLSCLGPDSAALSFGTVATVQVTTKDYVEPMLFIPPFPAVVPGWYNPEMEIYRGYWLISWFKREFAEKEVREAAVLGIPPEKLLNERLAEVPPGCDGLIFQPYFTPGLVMPHARGSIIGFSDVHTRIHIYRAIVEGINFGLMDGLQTIEKRAKMDIRKLFVAGGGSQSDEICQITANMFGLPVHRIQTHEVSGIGSSMVAFIAKGVFGSYEEAVARMVHIKDTFTPKEAEREVYRRLYDEVFTKIFGRLSPLYRQISEITDRTEESRHGASV
ncbi:MAG: FGGY-family carbohydrate kinase [Oscillospiraceae bacterium]|jgi:sugar (pentulose or hexulose) kinase|nr:FGGY-family carbohydrate kinase [Oscillospiraceae bacterium]